VNAEDASRGLHHCARFCRDEGGTPPTQYEPELDVLYVTHDRSGPALDGDRVGDPVAGRQGSTSLSVIGPTPDLRADPLDHSRRPNRRAGETAQRRCVTP
jgi:hypothetical protein